MASSTSLRKIWPMPARRSGNSSHQSTSHRLWARTPARRCVVVLGLGRLGEQHEAREERRHRVGEHHLGDDAVGLLLAVAHLVVPVAVPAGVTEVAEGVLVLPAPGVEVVEEPGIEVLAVLLVAAPGMAVGRDDRVALGGCCGHGPPPRAGTPAVFDPESRENTFSRPTVSLSVITAIVVDVSGGHVDNAERRLGTAPSAGHGEGRRGEGHEEIRPRASVARVLVRAGDRRRPADGGADTRSRRDQPVRARTGAHRGQRRGARGSPGVRAGQGRGQLLDRVRQGHGVVPGRGRPLRRGRRGARRRVAGVVPRLDRPLPGVQRVRGHDPRPVQRVRRNRCPGPSRSGPPPSGSRRRGPTRSAAASIPSGSARSATGSRSARCSTSPATTPPWASGRPSTWGRRPWSTGSATRGPRGRHAVLAEATPRRRRPLRAVHLPGRAGRRCRRPPTTTCDA